MFDKELHAVIQRETTTCLIEINKAQDTIQHYRRKLEVNQKWCTHPEIIDVLSNKVCTTCSKEFFTGMAPEET